MKKITLLIVAAVALIVTACTGTGAKKVADKIASGEVLTQSDYTILIDYCGDYAKKAQVIQDKIDNLESTDPTVAALQTELADLNGKFPYTDTFFKTLSSSTPEEVGTENMKKVDELSSLIWFTAPGWAQTVGPAGNAGVIETVAPAEADSNIIAAPVEDSSYSAE